MYSRDPLRTVAREPFSAAWAADYDRALAGLYGLAIPGASVMRARIYQRLGLFERLAAEMKRPAFDALEAAEAAEIASLAAVGFARAGRADEAERFRAVAGERARDANDPLLAVQLAHEEAVGDMHAGRFERSETKLVTALEALAACTATDTASRYRFEANHVRARILDQLRFHAARRDDRVAQERLSTDAVLCASLVRNRDLWVEAAILAGLAVTVYQYDSVSTRELLRVRSQAIPWTPHIDRRRVHIAGALRANDLLFKASRDVAAPSAPPSPTLAFRVARCVMELLYADWPDADAYHRELAFAVEIALQADWDGGDGEEFVALSKLVAIAAASDRAHAYELYEIYVRQRAKAPVAVLTLSPALRTADEAFMEGSVAKAFGEDERARRRFAEALRYFNVREIVHRAAVVGLERFALSGAPSDLEPAFSFARRYADTPHSRRVRAALERIARGRTDRFPYLGAYGSAQEVGAPR